MYTDIPPSIRPKTIATMLRMNTGFLRSSGVEKTNSPIVIGMRRVGKTVSTTRRFTFAARSFCIAGGTGEKDGSILSGVEDIAEEEQKVSNFSRVTVYSILRTGGLRFSGKFNQREDDEETT